MKKVIIKSSAEAKEEERLELERKQLEKELSTCPECGGNGDPTGLLTYYDILKFKCTGCGCEWEIENQKPKTKYLHPKEPTREYNWLGIETKSSRNAYNKYIEKLNPVPKGVKNGW